MIIIDAVSALITRTREHASRSGIGPTCLALVLFGTLFANALAASETSTLESRYNKHLTCAVYHRMVAGSFKRSGKGILAAPALDRMTAMIEKSEAMSEALGNDKAAYLSDWSETLKRLTAQINHNYKNIRQLKTRYQTRCTALQD
ncbi:MAG: hypothetical protein QNL18_03975 [Pseudomonadales bacterium]|jgi:hypothetical protein|tara:strand:+ start:1673 stop:2110 length:438 start_codon:yes stop_codon:yes gene_type:complete